MVYELIKEHCGEIMGAITGATLGVTVAYYASGRIYQFFKKAIFESLNPRLREKSCLENGVNSDG